MAIRNRTRSLTAAGGLDNALQALAPQPIQANRAPLTTDTAPIGTLWCYPATEQVWVNDGIVNAASQWLSISGGAGSFCDLTVTGTCGATNIQGGAFGVTIDSNTGTDINIGTSNNAAIGIGNGSGTTQDVSILGGSGSGAILISANGGNVTVNSGGGNEAFNTTNGTFTVATGTGAVTISGDAAANTIHIGTGAGVKTTAIGSLNTTSSTAIQSGTGGISLSSGATTKGLISAAPATPTAAYPTASVTANSRLIQATFTGFTTSDSGGIQAYTINSTEILATSACIVTVTNLNASTNGAFLTVDGIIQNVGSLVITTANNGAGALSTGDNVLITVWVLS